MAPLRGGASRWNRNPDGMAPGWLASGTVGMGDLTPTAGRDSEKPRRRLLRIGHGDVGNVLPAIRKSKDWAARPKSKRQGI